MRRDQASLFPGTGTGTPFITTQGNDPTNKGMRLSPAVNGSKWGHRVIAQIFGIAVVAVGAFCTVGGCSSNASEEAENASPSIRSGESTHGQQRLDGTFIVNFGGLRESIRRTEKWVIRSACRGDVDCTAAVTVSGFEGTFDPPVTEKILDWVDGHWVGINTVPYECSRPEGTKLDTVKWLITDIEPRPDGTLVGTYRSAAEIGPCHEEFPITVTRTGDAEPGGKVGNPAVLPARTASPAEALWGTYRLTETLKPLSPKPDRNVSTVIADTRCLRTGERCLTLMQNPEDSTYALNLVYANGHWSQDNWFPGEQCYISSQGKADVRRTITFPLPAPTQQPIMLLTGTERLEMGPPCAELVDEIEMKLERIGDA